MWHQSTRKIIPDELRELLKKEYWSHIVGDDPDPNECWFYNGKDVDYYPRISINHRQVTFHRFTHELFYGPVDHDKPYILHQCNKKSCINPNHLRCGTMRDNAIDRRFNKGEMILSKRDIKVIKYMRSLNYTFKEIAAKFNCSICKVRDVTLGINAIDTLPKWYTKPKQLV